MIIANQGEIEEAYETLLRLVLKAQKVREDMKRVIGDHSPFNYMPSKIESELRGIRKELINQAAEALRKTYMPNAKPDVDFHKMMSEKVGELGFKMKVLENWFLEQTRDKDRLEQISYEHLLSLARHFVPYTSDGQEWGVPRDPRVLLEKNCLILRAYTWRTKSAYVNACLSYSLNDRGQYNALEKLIDVVTLQSPATTVHAFGEWLTTHLRNHRSDADRFYGKHEIEHPAVEAFQFFKNDKFRIWFATEQQAEKVAYALCGQETKQKELIA